MRKVLAAATAIGLVFCGSGPAGAQAAAEAVERIYIHAGKVLAVPGEGYLNRRTIIIEDGRISQIAPGFQSPAEGAELIDLKEHFVLPGLIDSHVHLLNERGPDTRLQPFTLTEADAAFNGAEHARRTLMAGFTTVQDVGGSAEAIFALRRAANAGMIPAPRIRASGPSVSVTGGHGDVNGYNPDILDAFTDPSTCNGAEDCRRATRYNIRRGADLIKITATGGVLSNTAAGLGQQIFDDELEAIVASATSMGRRVTAHAHGEDGINAALRAGVSSIEHGTYLSEESIALFNETGAVLVPTVLAGATVTGWADEPWLPEPSRIKAAEIGPLLIDTLRRAREGGVTVAFGTDTGVSRHGDNADEFALMVEAGYSPEEAIRTATVVASAHVEMADDIGTLEPGKFADLIALDGDPLENVAELEDVDFVMRGGVVYKSE